MEPKWRLEIEVPRRALADFTAQRAGQGVVFVPTRDPVRAGETVEVTVRFEGFPHAFSMAGDVTAVRTQGRGSSLPAGVTVTVDKSHLPRLEKALAFARGERVPWHRRVHPRTRVTLPARIRTPLGLLEGRLRDLSPGGAGLSVDGELPSIGEDVELIVRCPTGLLPLRVRAKVMWLDFFSASRGFGVQFVEGGRSWKRRLARILANELARD